MSQIICKNLTVGYEGKAVLSNINFSVNEGDYFCIVGENGSGKSTLMKTILGLQLPIRGSITMDSKLSNKDIGYLPQQTFIQRDFPASVYEIVISGCQNSSRFSPFYTKEQKKMAFEAMKKMNIDTLDKNCYRELSGGQQQRVLLARALCSTNKILLLDEPVSGLDPKVTAEMYDLIKKLNEDDNITIIMISHDIKASVKYASHILYIGNDVFCGTKEDFLHSNKSKEFNIGGVLND